MDKKVRKAKIIGLTSCIIGALIATVSGWRIFLDHQELNPVYGWISFIVIVLCFIIAAVCIVPVMGNVIRGNIDQYREEINKITATG